MISFKGAHFPQEVILVCVRWYVAYPLSYRNIEEMMAERGVVVDHSTLNRWVIRFAPLVSSRLKTTVFDLQGINPWIMPLHSHG